MVLFDWEKWNVDFVLGWILNEDIWIELKGGKSDGEVVYVGCSMDGFKFVCESLGLYVEKKNISEVIKKVEVQVDYSYNDYVMDNFSLRMLLIMIMMMYGMQMIVLNKMEMEVMCCILNVCVVMIFEWDKVSLMIGIDLQSNKYGGNMIMYVMLSMNFFFKINMEFEFYGVFGELSYVFNDQYKLVIGVCVD